MKSTALLMILGVAAAAPPLSAQPARPASETVAPAAAGENGQDEMPVKHIKMVAENWKWSPNLIRVAQGTRVKIDFESRDSPHSFVLKAYDLNVKLPQDRPAKVEFVADKKGEFKWRCGRPCGNGCPKMVGQLIVE